VDADQFAECVSVAALRLGDKLYFIHLKNNDHRRIFLSGCCLASYIRTPPRFYSKLKILVFFAAGE
jgi:hypothetical protein